MTTHHHSSHPVMLWLRAVALTLLIVLFILFAVELIVDLYGKAKIHNPDCTCKTTEGTSNAP